MGLPSKRRTTTSKKERNSHNRLKKVQVLVDEKGNPYLPHHANPVTGDYKGKKVIDTKKRFTRLLKKHKGLTQEEVA